MYDPNWRQKALDAGKDQNSPEFAAARAAEASYNAGGGGAGNAMGAFQPQTIDLPSIYQKLVATSGIGDSQSQIDALTGEITTKQKARDEALAKINDNPFYSEATRTGRIAKLNDIYNNDATTLTNKQKMIQDQIATKKADIETQLNLQTKQFDINSAQATQALNQFNTLLAAGALDNASAEDIANITRATGMSSAMISGAISATKAKNVQSQVISYDDGTNQGYAVIDPKTGDIINKQVIAASKPEKQAKTPAADTKATQQADVQYLISLYKNVNKSNPSWQKAHDLRQQYSPADFLSRLLLDYPTQSAYIKANFKV